jgi:transcription antitermination factor NusG
MTSAARVSISLEPAELFWFAVQTRYRFEKRIAAQLTAQGMEVFLPLRKENRQWGDRKREVLVPLFPGYAFVHTDRSVWSRLIILQIPGVMGFVSSGNTAAIPCKSLEDLELLLKEGVFFDLCPLVKKGLFARIRGGPLDGVEGLLTQGETTKLLIPLEAVQRSIAVKIQGCDVELIRK